MRSLRVSELRNLATGEPVCTFACRTRRLGKIWDYTCETWDDDQAEKYVREIQRAIERVVDNPIIGRACDEVRPPATGSTLLDRTRCTTGLPAST